MNKGGVAILLLSSIGLLIAVIMFFSTIEKINVVGNSTFLGAMESRVFDTYLRGEQLMVFLENSARLSLKGKDFGNDFSKYLDKANRVFDTDIGIKDFDFERKDNYLRAVSSRSVVIKGGNVRYSLNPSFIVYY